MRKVAYVSGYSDMIGGGEHSLLELISALPEGYQPLLIVPQEGELSRRAAEKGVDSVCLPMPPIGIRTPFALFGWTGWLRKVRPDLIHANSPRTAFYAALAGKVLRIPTVFHCRVAAKDRLLDPLLVRMVDMIICNSQATASRFDAWPWKNPVVIYNGLDVKHSIHASADELPDRNLLFVGRLSQEKQPEIAWRVFRMLAGRFDNLNLLYVGGDDPDHPERSARLRSETEASGLSDRVVWVGMQADVSQWYGRANVVLVPSRYEGFGRVLVEAMAHGVPVVAFEVGGIPEVVENGRQGLLISPYDEGAMADAVARLLDDDALRQQMGEAGKKHAERFSVPAHVRAVAELYKGLLKA